MPASPRAAATDATRRARRRRVRRRRLVVATAVAAAGLATASVALAAGGSRHHGAAPPGTTGPGTGSTTRTVTSSGPPVPGNGQGVVPAGTYRVKQVTLPLIDTSRSVKVDGVVHHRHLPTIVWYPTDARGERPLIVFATGYQQCVQAYAPMLQAWASAGFVVAAPTFPLTNCAVPGGANEADLVNQPADMAFVTAEVLGASAGTGAAASAPGAAALRLRVDPAEVVMAGQSDGGETAAAVAYNARYAGTPVAAAMILSGELWPGFGTQWFPAGSPPLLVVQGTADTVNSEAESQAMYQADTTGSKVMVLLQGANHLGPYEGTNPTEQTTVQVTIDFLDAYVLGRPGASAALASDGNVAGVDTLQSSPGP